MVHESDLFANIFISIYPTIGSEKADQRRSDPSTTIDIQPVHVRQHVAGSDVIAGRKVSLQLVASVCVWNFESGILCFGLDSRTDACHGL